MSNEELAVLAQQGDRHALGQLWEQVKRLLYRMVNRFYARYGADQCARRGVTLADLEQEAFLALLDGVKAYKPSGKYQFTTYLSRASENRFRAAMGLRKRDPLDIADSLNAPAGDDDSDMEAGDLLPDPQDQLEAVDTEAETEYFRGGLAAGLARLDPMQSGILRRRFYGKQTRAQVAEALHITPETVRREEAKALRNLRGDRQIMALDYIESTATSCPLRPPAYGRSPPGW